MRRHLAARVAEALQRDPERADHAISLGLISRDWLEAPADRPVSDLPPLQALERWISRFVVEHPTLLDRIGHSVLEVLGEPDEPAAGEAVVTTRLAILFTDLEGFTEHTQRVGDTAASRLLTDHYATVDRVVGVRGGRVAKRLGDGLMVTFPTDQAGLAALVYLARLNSAEADIGEPLLLPAVAACVIGGASLFGGVGTIAGTLIGALILTLVLNGMNLLQVSANWQPFVTGVIVLAGVWIDMVTRKRTEDKL